MRLRQRVSLVDLQCQIAHLHSYINRLDRDMRLFYEDFEKNYASKNTKFTEQEINDLIRLNDRLAALERYLCDFGAKQDEIFAARVADPNDPLDDYEIEAMLYYSISKDDPEFKEGEEDTLTQRHISLKRLSRDDALGDGEDHREPLNIPGRINRIPHCWLFHDLYDHSYGPEQPALSLKDCLRVDYIWVDIAVHHQATLDIKSGQWLPPTKSSR